MHELRCPRCRSNRVEVVRKTRSALLFLAAAGAALILAQSMQLVWALVGVFLALALIRYTDKDTLRCLRCKHIWERETGKRESGSE